MVVLCCVGDEVVVGGGGGGVGWVDLCTERLGKKEKKRRKKGWRMEDGGQEKKEGVSCRVTQRSNSIEIKLFVGLSDYK